MSKISKIHECELLGPGLQADSDGHMMSHHCQCCCPASQCYNRDKASRPAWPARRVCVAFLPSQCCCPARTHRVSDAGLLELTELRGLVSVVTHDVAHIATTASWPQRRHEGSSSQAEAKAASCQQQHLVGSASHKARAHKLQQQKHNLVHTGILATTASCNKQRQPHGTTSLAV